MNEDWNNWCRLCGYKKKIDFDVNVRLMNTDETALSAAMKYFGILVHSKPIYFVQFYLKVEFIVDFIKKGNGRICHICNDVVKFVVKYNDHVLKVNEMFIDLEKKYISKTFDSGSLREKYGLLSEENNLYDHEIIANICPSQIKSSVQFKAEFDISPQYTKIEEYFNDINERNDFYEPFIEELNEKSWSEIKIKSEKPVANSLGESKSLKNVEFKREKKFSNIKDEKEKKFNLECEICHKVFPTKKGKTIHLKKQHSIKKGPPFKCNTCGRIFKRFQQLNIHESIHLSENERKYYLCPKCNKKFVSEWYVQDHIRIVHDGDRRFICELCGAGFGTNKNLVDHHLTHSEEKNFHCPKCSKAFKCKRTLKFHVETHDETEHPCQVCGLKLNTKRILRRHMLVHSDENKYKCNFCSKEFKRQYEFKNHLLLHTGLKLYQCSFCELTFSNGSNCRKHQRAIHPIELENAESKDTLMLVENVPSFKQLMAANEEVLSRNKS